MPIDSVPGVDPAAGMKLCCGCDTVKPLTEFATKPGRPGKRTRASRCKDCAREWQANYRREHSDLVNANARAGYERDPSRKKASKAAYYERHHDRIRQERRSAYLAAYAERPEPWRAAKARRRSRLAHRMSAADIALSVAYRQAIRDDACGYCGERRADDMHDDHYFPLAKGGTDHWWNIVRACGPCNRRKHTACGTRFFLLAA